MAIALEQPVLEARFNERFAMMKQQLVVSYKTFSRTAEDRAIAVRGGRANVRRLAELYNLDPGSEEGRSMAMSLFSYEWWEKWEPKNDEK